MHRGGHVLNPVRELIVIRSEGARCWISAGDVAPAVVDIDVGVSRRLES